MVIAGQLRPWHHLVGDGLTAEFAASSEALAGVQRDNGSSPHPDAHFAALSMQSAFLHGRTPMRSVECATYATAQPRYFRLLSVRPAAVVITSATRKNSKVRGHPRCCCRPPTRCQSALGDS